MIAYVTQQSGGTYHRATMQIACEVERFHNGPVRNLGDRSAGVFRMAETGDSEGHKVGFAQNFGET